MSLLDALFDATPARPTDPAAPWLIDRLIQAGNLTETGLSRRARPRPCLRCRTWTIAGLDADQCALEAHCDPTPLTPLGEVLALAQGRRTLELATTGGRLQLEQRWADHITGHPAGAGRYDVLATHDCEQPPIPAAYTAPSTFTPPHRATTEEPGF